jgi:hypothetical protein
VVAKVRRWSPLGHPIPTRQVSLGWSVGRDDHARGRHLAVDKPQGPTHTVIAEQTLAATHHDRVNHDSELVDQVALNQRLRQLAAADHVQVLAVLLLQVATASATSPWSTLEVCHASGSVSILDATYFG